MLRTASRGPITRIHLGRTIFGRPLRTVEAYLVDGLLIDSGPPATASEVAAWCRRQNVERVINTHHHEDHAGGDSLLQTSLGLPIAVPAEAVPVLQAARRLELYRRLAWGQPDSVEAEPLGEILETRSYRFAVVPTPGHSHDHVCFFEAEEGWLFSGDLFIHERARYLDVDEDAYEIMASLRRVLALEPQVMICAHAGFVENPCRAIERKIAYWQSLSEEARKLYDEGLSTEQITTTLMGAEGLATHLSRGRFSKRNLIASLLSRGI